MQYTDMSRITSALTLKKINETLLFVAENDFKKPQKLDILGSPKLYKTLNLPRS